MRRFVCWSCRCQAPIYTVPVRFNSSQVKGDKPPMFTLVPRRSSQIKLVAEEGRVDASFDRWRAINKQSQYTRSFIGACKVGERPLCNLPWAKEVVRCLEGRWFRWQGVRSIGGVALRLFLKFTERLWCWEEMIGDLRSTYIFFEAGPQKSLSYVGWFLCNNKNGPNLRNLKHSVKYCKNFANSTTSDNKSNTIEYTSFILRARPYV